MSKTSIKATIDDNIFQNREQKITGLVLNNVLNEMVDNEYEEIDGIKSMINALSIDVVTGVLTYQGKRFQLIAIADEEPIYTGAICGRGVCGVAICGTN